MPGCVLRVQGEGFDAPQFVRGTSLQPYQVENEGFKLSVSDASGDDLRSQIADATEFLKQNFAALKLLPHMKATLDFGVFERDFARFPAQSTRFPAELLRLAGSLGIDIELSRYAVSDEEEEQL